MASCAPRPNSCCSARAVSSGASRSCSIRRAPASAWTAKRSRSTPSGALMLAVGDHVLDTRAPGHIADHRKLRVTGGEDVQLRVVLPLQAAVAPVAATPVAPEPRARGRRQRHGVFEPVVLGRGRCSGDRRGRRRGPRARARRLRTRPAITAATPIKCSAVRELSPLAWVRWQRGPRDVRTRHALTGSCAGRSARGQVPRAARDRRGRHGPRARGRAHAERQARRDQMAAAVDAREHPNAGERLRARSARRRRACATRTSSTSTTWSKHGGSVFLVMELLEGETLGARSMRGAACSIAALHRAADRRRCAASPRRTSRA